MGETMNASIDPEAAVSLAGVDFVRNTRRILENVTWRIAQGEHWGLLGANGSGKTTLLKIVTGYEWPTRGEVCVLGQRFGQCDIRELRKLIGWVSTALEQRVPPRLSASRVVASGIDASIGTYRDFTSEEESRVCTALAAVNAMMVGEQAFGLLSQGEQQRVLIARALVAQPKLLILDEPCAGLDPTARHRFLDDMGALASASAAPTMILVTHHIEEIRPWIDRVLALRSGSVIAEGSRADVLSGSVLSRVFDTDCHVHEANGEYHLSTMPGSEL